MELYLQMKSESLLKITNLENNSNSGKLYTMITKKDYLISALIGFTTAVLLLIIFSFLNVFLPFNKTLLLLALPILWVLGMWMAGFLAKKIPFLAQFSKYAVAGFLSAAIDFAILNFMSYTTGITAGVIVGWINIPGFLVAVLNGYTWNRLWVFKEASATSNESFLHDFPKFFLVTSIGLVINSAFIILFTTYIPLFVPISNFLDDQQWLNLSKLLANAIVVVWNFAGYKFIVFKK